jgi:hypothetical protein
VNESLKKPGDSFASDTLTVQNAGSLAASGLRIFSEACADADNTETYHGTGNPCGKVQLYLQELNTDGTVKACLYGGGGGRRHL